MSVPEKIAYRVKDLMALTGFGKTTVYRAIESGELQSFRLRGTVLKSEFEAWLARAVDAGRKP